jgi:type 1 glutamine amidotransferase
MKGFLCGFKALTLPQIKKDTFMNRRIFFLSGLMRAAFLATVFFLCGGADVCSKEKKIRVLFATGGHDYDREGFENMLKTFPVTYEHVEHPNVHSRWKTDQAAAYDVILLYDMPHEISEDAKADFMALLAKGKGVVVLHHATGSYNGWPTFTEIAGGLYHHGGWKKEGVPCPPSGFKHDVTFQVKVTDPNHPVTKGVKDFQITDETYSNMEIRHDVHPLLSTDEPTSSPLVGWTNRYWNARIVTLTLGHDRVAWEHPAFRKILLQALLWVAEREK